MSTTQTHSPENVGEHVSAPEPDALDQVNFGDADPAEAVEAEAVEDAPAETVPVPAGGLDFETWYRELFVAVFVQGGRMMDLKTLQTIGDEIDSPLQRSAAEAIWRTCCEVEWLHVFVKKPNDSAVVRVATVAFWALPILKGCAVEIRARRAKPARKASDKRSPDQPKKPGETSAADDGLDYAREVANE